MTEYFTIRCEDGRLLHGSKYMPTTPRNGRVIVINSALGVTQAFYQPFAMNLAEQGFTVITWDPRGIGLSSEPKVKHDPATLRDWGIVDLTCLLDHIVDVKWGRWDDIVIIGHSAGGHLLGLCPRIMRISQIILICSGTCSWHLYPKRYQPKMMFAWYLLFPLCQMIMGYVPKRFGVGHDLPLGIASDWRNWSLNKNYLFDDDTLGEHFYSRYAGKLDAIGFSDDLSFSPRKTIEDLVQRFPQAASSVRIFEPAELECDRIGHFGFFKARHSFLWQHLVVNIIR